MKAFECACTYEGHVMIVRSDVQPDFRELSVHVQMSSYLPWFKRVAEALKYVFGLESRYHWAETIIREGDVAKLRDLLDEYIRTRPA